jgi:hypothetical protein
MTAAFLTPLADAPRQAFQNGFSATFVFYFAPVLKRLARMNASACGRPSLLLSWPRKKEGLGFFA